MPERVTDQRCENGVLVDPADPEKGMKRCANMVPRSEWPQDRRFPIICDPCLRANQQRPL